MSTGAKVAIVIFGLFFSFVFIAGCTTYSKYNSLVSYEEGLKAQYKQNQNNYDNMWKKFKEATQVPAMYADDLKKVYDGAIQARYGKEGSQAAFQWLKEHNPQFDSSMYVKLQTIIESGRNSFEANQKMLLDKKRVYETELRRFPTVLLANMMGFPKIDLDEIDIVTSSKTVKAFDSKMDDKEIKLR